MQAVDIEPLMMLRIGPFALAVLVFLWTAYDGARNLLPGWRSDSPVTTAGNGNPADRTAVDVRHEVPEIIDAHLFGRAPEQGGPVAVEAPETKLRIDLTGLIASANETLARAMITVDGSRVKTYSIGQSIEGTDASLHAVETRRVLLNRNQAIESLPLKIKEIGGSGETASVTAINTDDSVSASAQAGGNTE